jgi:hypothetical protein
MRILTAAVALLVCVVALGFAWYAWTSLGDVDMPPAGYGAMAVGVIATLVIGGGLMTLLFYSHRHGYDEGAGREDRSRRWR